MNDKKSEKKLYAFDAADIKIMLDALFIIAGASPDRPGMKINYNFLDRMDKIFANPIEKSKKSSKQKP